MPPSKTVLIKDIGPVLLERSARARRMNISIRPFKGIRVAVPHSVSFQTAELFAFSKRQWLLAKNMRMRELEKKIADLRKERTVDRKKARKVLTERVESIAREHGYRYNRLSIRNQKTRWGSCSNRNNISLNMNLTLLPDELRDYIILHELVHTKVKNHSHEFWSAIKKIEPRAGELARQVRQYILPVL